MVGRTGRREGAGQRKQDHFPARKVVCRGLVLPAKRVGAVDLVVTDAGFEGDVGSSLSDHVWYSSGHRIRIAVFQHAEKENLFG